MDEILEKFQTFSPHESKTSFDSLYKNWGRLDNQEQRRRDILEIQKNNRNNKLDKYRGILELVNAAEEKEIFKPYKKVNYRPNIYVAGFNRASTTYSNVLMLSEWLIEKPEDFNENWYVSPCPKGVRMLVIANQGITKCYTKYGHFRFQVRSAFPGGNPCDGQRNKCCVLDCFYIEKINTMFILDLLAWNNQPMTDCETEFRQYWLKTQLEELPDLKVINKRNQTIFKLLPMVPCHPDEFNKFMMTHPQFEQDYPALDGLLFYHRKAHYVAGETPLVGWLYPFMVPEVIGSDVTVHNAYMSDKPDTYVNQADYIQKFEEKNANRNRFRQNTNSSMDTSDQTEETKDNECHAATKLEENMDADENIENKINKVVDGKDHLVQSNGSSQADLMESGDIKQVTKSSCDDDNFTD